MEPGPAWDAINAAIGDDGHVSKETALEAFALAFGGLPGVTPPPGDPGLIPSGSMALRWLVGYWDQLTAAQRAAAVAAVPDLAEIGKTSNAPGSVILAVAHPPRPPSVAPAAAQHRSNAVYTQLANQMAGQIESHLGSNVGFDLTVDAHYGTPEQWTSGMETGVYDAKGSVGGIPAKCLITVSPFGDGFPDLDVQSMMAHEVWHCYEGAILGLKRYWSQNPADWIIEGEASWVGGTIVPESQVTTGLWWDYLYRPDLPLFKRSYSAIGFFGHLESVGIDPWTELVPMLQKASNEEAYAESGADSDPFLDSWASSLLDDPGRQQPWTLTGPAKPPPGKSKPAEIHLANGGSVEVTAAPYAMDISVFAESPEVLKTSFTGRARLSDNAGHDYLADDGDGTFCMLPTGCECPGASADEPPMLALDGAAVALGVTGGPKGASGTLAGTKLDDYCTKNITGTWDGSAEVSGYNVTNDFTLSLVQKGIAFKGTSVFTGPNCVHQADVTGTVSGSNITMVWDLPGYEPVDFEGTLSGKTMSGTFTAIGCPPENLSIGGPWSATKRK